MSPSHAISRPSVAKPVKVAARGSPLTEVKELASAMHSSVVEVPSGRSHSAPISAAGERLRRCQSPCAAATNCGSRAMLPVLPPSGMFSEQDCVTREELAPPWRSTFAAGDSLSQRMTRETDAPALLIWMTPLSDSIRLLAMVESSSLVPVVSMKIIGFSVKPSMLPIWQLAMRALRSVAVFPSQTR